MRGQIFIVRSDLLKLRADAWLVPTDAAFSVTRGWRQMLSRTVIEQIGGMRHDLETQPPGWGNTGRRAVAVSDDEGRLFVLTNVGGVSQTPPSWYAEGVRQFVNAAMSGIELSNRHSFRALPLLALPVVGTGKGGASDAKGSVVYAIVETLLEEVERRGVDIALVVKDGPLFTAAQNARRSLLAMRDDDPISEVGWELAREAARLAGFARAGRLVLFLGAGVSRGAGLPGWGELLDRLAQSAELSSDEQAALRRLNELDRARIIGRRLADQRRNLGNEVAAMLESRHLSLAHALLASLPVAEAVTTNYDDLFELACDAAGRPVAVLPYQPVSGELRWLLKLHGSVSHPDDIVLTREDYLRYADRRAALAAIVQAMLITRHMLFVGFSLTDDNFHRIVDDVRKAIRGHNPSGEKDTPFGTALLLRGDPLLAELWRDDLDIVAAGESGSDDPLVNARRLEILLDLVLAEATRGVSPLLDPAYAGLLSEPERAIRDALLVLEQSVSPEVKQSAEWEPVAQLLRKLGGQRNEIS